MGMVVPTLYKQYTETYQEGDVHFLGFNIDPDFNHCIDGLELADLNTLKPKKEHAICQNSNYLGEKIDMPIKPSLSFSPQYPLHPPFLQSIRHQLSCLSTTWIESLYF